MGVSHLIVGVGLAALDLDVPKVTSRDSNPCLVCEEGGGWGDGKGKGWVVETKKLNLVHPVAV